MLFTLHVESVWLAVAIVCHIPTPETELCLFPFKKDFKHLLHSVKKTESI